MQHGRLSQYVQFLHKLNVGGLAHLTPLAKNIKDRSPRSDKLLFTRVYREARKSLKSDASSSHDLCVRIILDALFKQHPEFAPTRSLAATRLDTTLFHGTLQKLPEIQNAQELVRAFESLKNLDEGAQHAKDSGSVFTPIETATHVLRRLGYPESSKSTLIDPACGGGIFLLAALDLAIEKGIDPTSIASNLYGVDRDPLAVEVAIFALKMSVGSPIAGIEDRIICADSLYGNWPLKAASFIVGNPPWVSYSGRHAVDISSEALAQLRESFRSVRKGWPALHSAFVERALQEMRVDSRLGYLLPRQVAEADGYVQLRELLEEGVSHEARFEDLGEGVFKGISSPATLLTLVPCSQVREGARVSVEEKNDRLHAYLDTLPRFPEGAFGDVGIHTGNCARKLILQAESERSAPVYQGRDIFRFRLSAPQSHLRLDYDPDKGEYFRIQPLHNHQRATLLLRQTAPRPIAAVHDPAHHFRNSCLACFGVEWIPTHALAAVLNSALFGWIAKHAFQGTNQERFPQIKISHLRSLPLPPRTREGERIVAELGDLGMRASSGDGSKELFDKIDRLVCELYGIPERFRDSIAQFALNDTRKP